MSKNATALRVATIVYLLLSRKQTGSVVRTAKGANNIWVYCNMSKKIFVRLVLIWLMVFVGWIIVDVPQGPVEIRNGTVTSAVFITSRSGGYTRIIVRDNTGTGVVWVFSTFGSSSIKEGDFISVFCRRRRLTGLDSCKL